MSHGRAVAVAVLLACASCTSPPRDATPLTASADPQVLAFQQSLDEALSHEPAAIQRRYLARVVAVERAGTGLLFDIEIERAASFGSKPRRHDIIAACREDALDDCVRKTLAAIRGVAALD